MSNDAMSNPAGPATTTAMLSLQNVANEPRWISTV
jgi:hypothetical protein